jgi:hypothetical protein
VPPGCANIRRVSRPSSYTLRFQVLPWVLGALLLRASIPAGFMPMPGGSLSAAMCSTQGMASEIIEIPGGAPAAHCDYCVAPSLATPPALPDPTNTFQAVEPSSDDYAAPQSRFALIRAQSARAPPG